MITYRKIVSGLTVQVHDMGFCTTYDANGFVHESQRTPEQAAIVAAVETEAITPEARAAWDKAHIITIGG
jgi:hypothetical protein